MTLQVRKSARLEDPGAELLARGAEIWNRYGRLALGGLAVVGVALAVTLLTLRSRAASEEQAAGKLAEANVLYWQGEYDRSLQMARQIAEQYPSTPSGIDAHRLAGDNAYWDGDFKAAISEYQTYLELRKEGLLADAVRRSLAYAFESDRRYLEAANVYESLIGRFDRESSAEFLASSARCHLASGQPQEAIQRLRRLVDEFGETSHMELARVKLAELSAPAP